MERALCGAAPAEPTNAESADELMLATGLKKRPPRAPALEHLCAKGKLKRLGSGTKGSRYGFSRPAARDGGA
jgi:hypothetical protein